MPFLRLIVIYGVVILAVVGFFQRDSLMQMLGLSLEGDHLATASAPATDSEPAPDARPAASSTATPAEPAAQPPAPTSAPTSAPVTAPVATPAPAPLQTPVAEPAPNEQPKPQPTQPIARPSALAGSAPAPAEPAASPAPDDGPSLQDARQAYWRGDMVGAETAYLALVNKAPENADLMGELGNFYYGQRKYAAAADYYFRAGKQLLKDGNTQQAMALIGVLQSIAPSKAAELRALATDKE